MMNPLNFMRIMRNPQGFFDALSKNKKAMENPMVQNAVNMVQNQDGKGLEGMVRNLCKNVGANPDELYNQVKQSFGIK